MKINCNRSPRLGLFKTTSELIRRLQIFWMRTYALGAFVQHGFLRRNRGLFQIVLLRMLLLPVLGLLAAQGSRAAATATTIVTPAVARVLSVAFVGCKVSDVPGLAVVNYLQGQEWTQDRIRAWVDDPDVGFKAYMDSELFREVGISSQVWVDDWKDIGPYSKYKNDLPYPPTLGSDCLGAHYISAGDFDVVVMFFNIELGSSYGGGGQVFLSKWNSPSPIHHEVQHAMSIERLGLQALFHSNMADYSLNTVPLNFANAYSLMYGNGEYLQRDPLDNSLVVDPEFGPAPMPLTTANRWMANVLPAGSVCAVPNGESSFTLRAWGESGSTCLLLTIPQSGGKILTVELQPTLSPFQQRKLDFLQGLPPGSRYLVGVRYPSLVSPNATDWAAIFDPSIATQTSYGEYYIKDNEKVLFKPGQTVNIGNAVLAFGSKTVQIRVPVSPVSPYDGIYQWDDGYYLSVHQIGGGTLIGTIYWVYAANTEQVGTRAISEADTFDLFHGQLVGSSATMTGTRFYRACTFSYDFTFNSDSSLSVSLNSVSNSPGVSVADVDCAARYNPVGSVWTIPRIY